LSNGTWVVAGNLRTALLGVTLGVLQDIVIAGENRETCVALAWLNPAVAKAHMTDAGNLQQNPGVLEFLTRCFQNHNANVGSSERVSAFLLLEEPPSLAAGEITDKAYVNQRAVLDNRADIVELLYSSNSDHHVCKI